MRRDALFVTEMLDAAERIIELVGDLGHLEGQHERVVVESLLWNFTVLGEAAARVSPELKDAHPKVPWSDPVRMRNRIVHGYWSVMVDTLIATGQDDLPDVVASLRSVLDALE